MASIAVELDQVSKFYPSVKALQPLTMQIQAGEVLGLFGHNGAGKSTLMKLILGVLKPTSGHIKALGHCPRSNRSHEYRTRFGYLPENVSFYEHLSGREVLNYLAKLKGHSKTQADHLLAEVNLADAADRAVKTYSKGMRQRLGLAQAFLGEPKLLILDEPTVGLDPVATQEFYHTVDKLKSGGCAVILCSHVLPGVERHIDRAMILSQGKKLALGALPELRQQAQLPVEVSVSGLNQTQLEQSLNGFARHINWPGDQGTATEQIDLSASAAASVTPGQLTFHIEPQHKVDVVRHLSQQQQLEDIQIRLPSLEDVYRHYLNQFESSEQNGGQL